MLSPEDIEQKTFSTALRGYDLNEVDDFLDEIMATIRDLHEQLETARSGQPPAQQAIAPSGEATAIDESAVGRALVAAQEAADRIVAEANAEADRIREGAKEEADSWVTERQQARAAAEQEMADLSARVDGVRRELALLATNVADSLDRMDEAIAEAQPVDDTEDDAEAAIPRHAAGGDGEPSWGGVSEDESPDGLSPEDDLGTDSEDDGSFDSPDEDDHDDEGGDEDAADGEGGLNDDEDDESGDGTTF